MTPELTRFINALKIQFAAEIKSGDIRHLGTYNCRRKNNTATGPWSEHAWPNAVDIMLRSFTGRKALGDRIAAWARSRKDLASEVFWWVEFHYDHVHVTANPRRNYDNKQVPPCAGGPAIEPIETGDDDMSPKDWTDEDWDAIVNNAQFRRAVQVAVLLAPVGRSGKNIGQMLQRVYNWVVGL